MDRAPFFFAIRKSVFGGKLSESQVDGIEKILDYRDVHWPAMPDEELAYVLATVAWETARTMRPVSEGGGAAYLRSKPYYPWYGRGLVQLTWERNYKKFDVAYPAQMLEWPTSLRVLFEGMIYGKFTGKKLADYITAERQDFVGARKIINGTDRALAIAKIAEAFLIAFHVARESRANSGDDHG